jgi:thiol-disulfide isomerase/thioredoxin
MSVFARCLISLLLAIALAGCDRGRSNEEAPAEAQPPAITVRPLDRAGFADFLLQHRGQVVLIDFWATWCPPCMEGFPESVRLSQKYAQQGLVVASMAIEDLDDQSKVLEFLRTQQADFPNFISAYGGSDGRAMQEFEISSGTIPTLKLYDREGNLRETFGDGLPFTIEEVEVAIRQLLLKG